MFLYLFAMISVGSSCECPDEETGAFGRCDVLSITILVPSDCVHHVLFSTRFQRPPGRGGRRWYLYLCLAGCKGSVVPNTGERVSFPFAPHSILPLWWTQYPILSVLYIISAVNRDKRTGAGCIQSAGGSQLGTFHCFPSPDDRGEHGTIREKKKS